MQAFFSNLCTIKEYLIEQIHSLTFEEYKRQIADTTNQMSNVRVTCW